jgi:predicted nucleotidyltransferase
MAKMTVEQWVEKLKNALGENLLSVVLFGSSASGDHAGALSDTNLLVVASHLGLEDLQAVAEVAAPWLKQGNPPPVLLTKDEIQRSADVFPVEFSDLEDVRQVLFGSDPMEGLVFRKTTFAPNWNMSCAAPSGVCVAPSW